MSGVIDGRQMELLRSLLMRPRTSDGPEDARVGCLLCESESGDHGPECVLGMLESAKVSLTLHFDDHEHIRTDWEECGSWAEAAAAALRWGRQEYSVSEMRIALPLPPSAEAAHQHRMDETLGDEKRRRAAALMWSEYDSRSSRIVEARRRAVREIDKVRGDLQPGAYERLVARVELDHPEPPQPTVPRP